MLGRKIIQVYPDENNGEVPSKPQTGLPIRRVRTAGLRIITENESSVNGGLQVPAPKLGSKEISPGALSAFYLRTPNTSHTFGVPNPTVNKHTDRDTLSPPGVSPEVARTRRQLRYSREESALRSTLQLSSSEPTCRDLQIRALERATSLLSAHAQDAQQRASKLRACLADRELEPEAYQSLQRERWMEERRTKARFEETEALRQLLLKLSDGGAEQELHSQPRNRLSKQQSNLVQFYRRSPTRLSLPHRRWMPLHYQDMMQRSRTISDVRSMRLRTSALVASFSKPIKIRLRCRSLDVSSVTSGNQPTKVRAAHGSIRSAESLGLPSSASSKANIMPTILSSLAPSDGVATIYGPALPRTLEEIAAEMHDVGIPEYAVNLLDRFDDIDADVKLPNVIHSPHPSLPMGDGSPRTPTQLNGSLPTRSLVSPHFSTTERASSIPRSTRPLHSQRSKASSPLRRPLSTLLFGLRSGDSIASGSMPNSSLDSSADDDAVLREGAQTPSGSHRSEKHQRWSIPSLPRSPKVLSKMKNRLSVLGRK